MEWPNFNSVFVPSLFSMKRQRSIRKKYDPWQVSLYFQSLRQGHKSTCHVSKHLTIIKLIYQVDNKKYFTLTPWQYIFIMTSKAKLKFKILSLLGILYQNMVPHRPLAPKLTSDPWTSFCLFPPLAQSTLWGVSHPCGHTQAIHASFIYTSGSQLQR